MRLLTQIRATSKPTALRWCCTFYSFRPSSCGRSNSGCSATVSNDECTLLLQRDASLKFVLDTVPEVCRQQAMEALEVSSWDPSDAINNLMTQMEHDDALLTTAAATTFTAVSAPPPPILPVYSPKVQTIMETLHLTHQASVTLLDAFHGDVNAAINSTMS